MSGGKAFGNTKRQKALARKERTHRLCTRAVMLESYLPHPAAITDRTGVSLFLKLLFHQDSTRQLVERIFAGNGSLEAKDTDWERP
ncbi:MAG: DUF3847 domain-containing protein [Clostridiaceae bacterium]